MQIIIFMVMGENMADYEVSLLFLNVSATYRKEFP
jgi:hypothetical protein